MVVLPQTAITREAEIVKLHRHSHIEFYCITIACTFYYLCAVLDGCSHEILSWHIRPGISETGTDLLFQRAPERFPHARPRIFSDDDSQSLSCGLLPVPRGFGNLAGRCDTQSWGLTAPVHQQFVRL